MSAQLVPINAGTALPVAIARPVVLIGRHPECDVRIDAPEVSRRHCCVALAYDRLLIRDLGSSNGVRVNGRLVEEAQLRSGDEVAIAQFLYRLVVDAPPPSARAPEAAARPKPEAELPPPIIELDDDFIPLSN